MSLGFTEILLIFLVVLLFFGAKRLPEVARAMGKAVNEFKKAKDEILTTPPPSASHPDTTADAAAKPEEKKAEDPGKQA